MAESLVDSPIDDRIKSRNVFLRVKGCSPKFKSVLRQKYRERIENDRLKMLDRFRHTDIQSDLCKTANKMWLDPPLITTLPSDNLLETHEKFNLDEELLLEETINQELSQFENWLLQGYEHIWREDAGEIIITCPLCCSGYFKTVDAQDSFIICTNCNASFFTKISLLEIQNEIFDKVNDHNSQCLFNPAFVSVPGDETHANLCIVCDTCGCLQVII